ALVSRTRATSELGGARLASPSTFSRRAGRARGSRLHLLGASAPSGAAGDRYAVGDGPVVPDQLLLIARPRGPRGGRRRALADCPFRRRAREGLRYDTPARQAPPRAARALRLTPHSSRRTMSAKSGSANTGTIVEIKGVVIDAV